MTLSYVSLKVVWLVEVLFFSTIYVALFWKIFSISKINLPPKQSLLMATNTISTTHSVIMCLSFYDFFAYKRWETPIIAPPRLVGHLYAIGDAYMIVDLLGHIICFCIYSKAEIPRRWDIIAHHFVTATLFWFYVYPKEPVYLWTPCSAVWCIEMTTIFLNMQW
eukprot:268909_1